MDENTPVLSDPRTRGIEDFPTQKQTILLQQPTDSPCTYIVSLFVSTQTPSLSIRPECFKPAHTLLATSSDELQIFGDWLWSGKLQDATKQRPVSESESSQIGTRAVDAVDDLKRWLGFSEQRLSHLAGFSRGSIKNWRTGRRAPYPATIRGLLEIHSIVRALISELGAGGAVSWLDIPDAVAEIPRVELLASPDGRRSITRQANSLLFERNSTDDLPSEDELNELDRQSSSKPRRQESANKRPVRRARRL